MEMPQKSIRQQRIYQPAHPLYKRVCQVLSRCTFCNPSTQFPFHSAAMTGCSKASHFFPSMIPIVLIEAITSPCKPCLHGILRPSWPKHRCRSPLLHIRLISALHHPLVLQEMSNNAHLQTRLPPLPAASRRGSFPVTFLSSMARDKSHTCDLFTIAHTRVCSQTCGL